MRAGGVKNFREESRVSRRNAIFFFFLLFFYFCQSIHVDIVFICSQEQRLVILPQSMRKRGRRPSGLASSVPGHDRYDRGAARSTQLLLYVSILGRCVATSITLADLDHSKSFNADNTFNLIPALYVYFAVRTRNKLNHIYRNCFFFILFRDISKSHAETVTDSKRLLAIYVFRLSIVESRGS